MGHSTNVIGYTRALAGANALWAALLRPEASVITPGRDPEYPSQIWRPPRACEHEFGSLRLQGVFYQDNPELSLWVAHCLRCGSEWSYGEPEGAPYNRLMQMIAEGHFGVVSAQDPDIDHKVEWRRQCRYDQIMEDACGDDNPIASSTVELKRP